jgi:hypothetical protein
MAVLRASVERARAARAEPVVVADAPPQRATARRTTHDPTGTATAAKRAKARAESAPTKVRTKKTPERKVKSGSKA